MRKLPRCRRAEAPTLPAGILRLTDCGAPNPGVFADVVVFEPSTVADRATFASPYRYSTGVSDLSVNGVQVVKAEAHTGAKQRPAVKGRRVGRC